MIPIKDYSNKKIGLFIANTWGGGAEKVLVNMANGFSRLGVDVTVFIVTGKPEFQSRLDSTVNLISLEKPRALACIPNLCSYVKKQKPDAFLSTLQHGNIAALITKLLCHSKTRFVVREVNTISQLSKKSKSLKLRFSTIPMKLFYPFADGIIAVSNQAADDLAQTINIPRKRITVIYNPAILDDIIPKASQPVDHIWFQDKNIPIIISVGRLSPQKDYSTLIKGFFEVKKVINSRLVILGDGECREELDYLINELGLQDSVSMPGFVNNPHAFVSRSSVFALSSIYEGMPNVMIEALSLGIPVVSTDCPSGPFEVLENGRYGKLVPMRDPAALAKALVETLTTKPDIDYKQTIKRFDYMIVVGEYLKVLIG